MSKVQSVCANDGCENLTTYKSRGNYSTRCSTCLKTKNGTQHRTAHGRKKKKHCELCDFKALHPSQLDVDHIDGDHSNWDQDNLQTLCANCHRLKTFLNRDWE